MAYIVCTSNLDLVSFLFVPALYSTLKLEIFLFISYIAPCSALCTLQDVDELLARVEVHHYTAFAES